MSKKKRTLMLGFVFLLLLIPAYLENSSFFRVSGDIFLNPILAVLFIFVHNVLVVPLILRRVIFYVGFVLTFMPKRKIENVMLQNPRIIAFVFTIMISLSSILRASMLVYGQVFVDSLVFVILLNTRHHRGIRHIPDHTKNTEEKDYT